MSRWSEPVSTELPRGSTHLASINRPAPWRRRAVDPISQHPDPAPAAPGSVFPLRRRSPPPYSPFLHCGPGPFGVSTLSQEPTESPTSQPTGRAEVSEPIRRGPLDAAANHSSRNRCTSHRGTNGRGEGERPHFSTPPVESAEQYRPVASRGLCGTTGNTI